MLFSKITHIYQQLTQAIRNKRFLVWLHEALILIIQNHFNYFSYILSFADNESLQER